MRPPWGPFPRETLRAQRQETSHWQITTSFSRLFTQLHFYISSVNFRAWTFEGARCIPCGTTRTHSHSFLKSSWSKSQTTLHGCHLSISKVQNPNQWDFIQAFFGSSSVLICFIPFLLILHMATLHLQLSCTNYWKLELSSRWELVKSKHQTPKNSMFKV